MPTAVEPSNGEDTMSVIIKPSEIERSSMGIIETELQERGITLDPEKE